MSLKDLLVSKAKVTEEEIKETIDGYVGYDADALEVVLLPGSAKLDATKKILLYLVALRGWRYVVDAPPKVAAKPGEISEHLGIGGGTVRPVLKKLKEGRVVRKKGGEYMVPEHNFHYVRELVRGAKEQTVRRPGERAKRKGLGTQTRSEKDKTGPKALVRELISDGFFAEGRTLGDVRAALDRDRGYKCLVTSLSGPMRELVRGKRLKRRKVKRQKGEVYEYVQAG